MIFLKLDHWVMAKEKLISLTKQLYTNPEECIDCALCQPECPINAISSEYDENHDK